MFQQCSRWSRFTDEVIKAYADVKALCVFDPCSVKKSDKKTYFVGQFWSGVAGRALRGLEVGRLCFVDLTAGTVLQALAKPPYRGRLTEETQNFYKLICVVKKQVTRIVSLTHYVAVDGYFAKKSSFSRW